MGICDPKGRDCIEENSSKTFKCNTTCVGIYADVQWVAKFSGVYQLRDENIKDVLEGKINDDLLEIILTLKSEQTFMRNGFGELMNIATGQRGEELDRKKFKRLISEYGKFKTKNVKHYRFNSAAKFTTFGEL